MPGAGNMTLRLCSWSFKLLQFLAGGGKEKKATSWCNCSCFQLPIMQQAGTWICFRPFPFSRPLPPSSYNNKKWPWDIPKGWGTHQLLHLKCRIAFEGSDFFHQCPVAPIFGCLCFFLQLLVHSPALQKATVVAHQEPRVRTRPCTPWWSLPCVQEVGWYLACWPDLPSGASALAEAWGLKTKSKQPPKFLKKPLAVQGAAELRCYCTSAAPVLNGLTHQVSQYLATTWPPHQRATAPITCILETRE